jgi:LemA protein
MGITGVILLVVLSVGVIYLVMVYNQLVQIKHNVSKAWANIDVLLKQRHDELPKLVETCRQYMKFEQDTLTRVMQARSNVSEARAQRNIGALGHAEGELRGAVGRLFAVAEAYPDLKTNQTFVHLQGRISSLENGIADRREFYNESVNVNNVRIEQFPDSMIAALFSFRPAQLLRFSPQETSDVSVKELFQA